MSGVSTGANVFPSEVSNGTTTGGVVGFGSAVTWGDGADGDVVIGAGTTLIARDMFYNSLTVQNGGILKPQGFRIFVKTFTQVDTGGTINDNGNPGVGSAAGTALTSIGWMQVSCGGGGIGRNTSGVGNNGSALTNAITTNGTAFARGGAGANAGVNTGGTGGVVTIGTSLPGARLLTSFTNFRGYLGAAFNGTSGGGGGGATIVGPDTGTSGGGGGAGRSVWIASNTIILNGTISANGGAGANAVGTGAAVVGGGGGGAGGLLVCLTTSNPAILTNMTVTGGTPGTSFGAVTSASVAGDAGHKLIIQFSS